VGSGYANGAKTSPVELDQQSKSFNANSSG